MKEKNVMQGVLWWDDVIAKCTSNSKICRYLLSEIMKIIDERETQKQKQKKKKNKNKDRWEQGGTEAIVNGWELNDFVVHLS